MFKHHSFVVFSDDVAGVVERFLQKYPVVDTETWQLEKMGIDEARALISTAFSEPKTGDKRLLIIACRNTTVEAEQALLKILEEPPVTTVFLFVVPAGFRFLPTLNSRFFDLTTELASKTEEVSTVTLEFFLDQTYAERLAEIAKRLKDEDISWVRNLKRELLAVVRTGEGFGLKLQEKRALILVLDFLDERGASNKMLLEELALTLPVQPKNVTLAR